jgi:hypothetical protein
MLHRHGRLALLTTVIALGAAAVPAAATAADVTPTVTSATAPAPLPAGLSFPGATAGSPVPTGATVLSITLPPNTPIESQFTVTCPTGTAAAAWTSGLAEDAPGTTPGSEAFSTMLPNVTGGSVLCAPAVTATTKRLPKGTKIPKAIATGDQVKLTPTIRKTSRLVRVTISGLQPSVPSIVPKAVCPASFPELVAITPVKGVSVSLTLQVTSSGPTSATFTGLCLSLLADA